MNIDASTPALAGVMQNPPKQKNIEIQILRGIAIIFVLLHHYKIVAPNLPLNWYGYVEGMWSGVDLFFCISGYVISKSVINKFSTSNNKLFWNNVLAFWVKRAYRILPSAWLWILITMINVLYLGWGNNLFISQNLGDSLSAIFQVANFHFYQCTYDQKSQCGIMSIYWSLSLEEQFYLIFPLLFYFFRNRIISVILFALVIQIFMPRAQWDGLSSFIRTDAILLGVLLSFFEKNNIYNAINIIKITPIKLLTPLLFIGLALVPALKIIPFYMGLTALICVFLVWLASYNIGLITNNKFLTKLLAWVGERSFSIYLIHIVTFSVVRLFFENLHLVNINTNVLLQIFQFLIGISITFFIAQLNYIYIEKPWIAKGHVLANNIENSPA